MSHKVTLTFNASVVDATHDAPTEYDFKKGTVSGGPYLALSTIPASGPFSFFDTDVIAGSKYFYVVTAKNTSESVPSNEVEALIPFFAPTAPTQLAAVVA